MKALVPVGASSKIVILSGAGLSAASGLRAFRDKDGLYSNPEILRHVSGDSFEDDPQLVLHFLEGIKAEATRCSPNGAHRILAELETRVPGGFLIVTLNIDGLHQRAGSRNVVEYHGSVFRSRCLSKVCGWRGEAEWDHLCPVCGAFLRPDVVLFGEYIPVEATHRVKLALRECTLFVAVGTSNSTWPANSLASSAKFTGATTVCINTDPRACDGFDIALNEDAETGLRHLLGDFNVPQE